MHSRIIQLSKEPLDEYEWIKESDYYESWFVGSIADYVSDIDEGDRERQMKSWLGDFGSRGLKYDEKDMTLTVVDKGKYFEAKYSAFIDAAKKVQAATLEQFSGYDLDRMFYQMREAYEDKFGIYIDGGNETGLITMDEFMRYAKNGDVFYCGGIVDYHF